MKKDVLSAKTAGRLNVVDLIVLSGPWSGILYIESAGCSPEHPFPCQDIAEMLNLF